EKLPFDAVVVVAPTAPFDPSSATCRPAMPSSSGNTWPRAAGCDGEKSRHTRPTIAPFDDAGTSAGVAWFAWSVVGLIPVRPSSIVPPAVTVVLLSSVPPGPDCTPVAASAPT